MKTKIILTMLLALNIAAFANVKDKKKSKSVVNTTVAPSNVCLTGTIIDSKTKETLAGVEVTIEGSNLKTYTDFDGMFSFENLKPGTYKVSAAIISYDKVESKQLEVKSNEMHSLNMELSTQNTIPQMDASNALPVYAGN